MKKEYRKPNIIFENFALSANIAGACGTGFHSDNSCDKDATHANGDSCVFIDMDTGLTFFAMGCDVRVDLTNENDICYHVPTDDTKMFSS